jgi:hypothetical protein
MRRRSQWMFFARSSAVEREVGRMIHRIMRDMTSRLRVSLWECSVIRKEGIVVEGARETRWMAQTGMMRDDYGKTEETKIVRKSGCTVRTI